MVVVVALPAADLLFGAGELGLEDSVMRGSLEIALSNAPRLSFSFVSSLALLDDDPDGREVEVVVLGEGGDEEVAEEPVEILGLET